ncbi:uncharacterized protein V1518DRAFT_374045 [Limtongia smithiae]|uniref:uncharacterized protein n=1 Tax=Limtongia smithiae TaxID=1125753 RepID=UPI0034CD9746
MRRCLALALGVLACALRGVAAADEGPESVKVVLNQFDGTIAEYHYLESPASATDQTVIMRMSDYTASISHDHGATWSSIESPADVIAVYPHPYDSDRVYLVTSTTKLLVSTDRGKKFNIMDVPTPPSKLALPLLSFHKTKLDWLIWHGEPECPTNPSADASPCTVATAYSKNNGKSWKTMMTSARQCVFVTELQQATDDNLVFCERNVGSASSYRYFLQLVSSTDYFKNAKNEKVHFEDIIGFTAQNDFLIVAAIATDRTSLRADVSIDGVNFAEAKFPPNLKVSNQQAYTILDTSTKAIVMHLTSGSAGFDYGTILKSNSNGTAYVTSIEYVNRDSAGYVDYEKMQGIEGVSVINVVSNPSEVTTGAAKKLRSKISFNDGGLWNYIVPPATDSNGASTECTGGLDQCSLNLHGYTERVDVRDTFSSASATGLMIGVGNVGSSLTKYGEGNMYLTRDGGASWKELAKGTYMWEYGDQGSIIVLVETAVPTNTVRYTFDEGATWHSYQFNDEVVQAYDISTVPSDTSRKFLIHARLPASYGEKTLMVQLDFTGTTSRQCVLNEKKPEADDFELWTPKRPGSEDGDCLFGHEIQYNRKIPDHFCYIGKTVPQPHTIVRDCPCTRHDYECDMNYMLMTDGSCGLVPNYSPPNHQADCLKNPNQVEWFDPTGYRRIPLTTCTGGNILDGTNAHACPGHESEFDNRRRGIHGFALFALIVLPFIMAGVVSWLLYQHYYGQYGQIRLGDTEFDTRFGFGTDNGLLKYPIMAVSAIVAFVTALPFIAQHMWTSFTTRRGRGARPSRLYRSRTGGSGTGISLTARGGVGNGLYSRVGGDDLEQTPQSGLHDLASDEEDSDDDAVFGRYERDAPHVNLPEPDTVSPIASPVAVPAAAGATAVGLEDIVNSPESMTAELAPASPELKPLDPPPPPPSFS